MRGVAVILVLFAGCLFDGAQTEGLPCNNDGECGVGIDCIERVCGGPTIAADTDTDTDTDTDAPEESSESTAADDDSVRDYCVPEDTMCLDANTVRYCSDDGKLTTVGCPGACGENVETIGCMFHPTEGTDICVCTFDIQSCTSSPGAYACGGAGLTECIDSKLQHYDCDDICVGAGYAGADSCQGTQCQCGTTCSEAAQRCTDGNTIAGCWGGSWYPESCDAICRDNGYTTSFGCFFYPGDDSGCMCA